MEFDELAEAVREALEDLELDENQRISTLLDALDDAVEEENAHSGQSEQQYRSNVNAWIGQCEQAPATPG